MKKLFYFACASLLALGTVSCDDDDEAPVRSLSATPGTLTFTATPDTPKTIDVKAENVSWKATTEAGWLKRGRHGRRHDHGRSTEQYDDRPAERHDRHQGRGS